MNGAINPLSIQRTAIVAGLFSAFVGVVLLSQLFTQPADLALDNADYLALKERLAESSDDPHLQRQLRDIDVGLRERYFRRQQFTQRGAYLLAGGLFATILLAQWSLMLRPRSPQLMPASIGDREARRNYQAQWAIGGVGALLVLSVAIWQAAYPSALANSRELVSERSNAEPVESEKPHSDKALDYGVHEKPISPAADETPPTAAEYAANWYRFRGPTGGGVVEDSNLPKQWDANSGQSILWKTPVPLPGLSSPVCWNDRVFLTGANRDERCVYCFDASSGKLLWQKPVAASESNAGRLRVDDSTGYAAPTPATDGRRLYAIFATGDVAAFDFEGNQIWRLGLGLPDNPYGHAASLDLSGNRLIIQFDQGDGAENLSRLLALNVTDGKVVWEVKRDAPVSWSSPLVARWDGQPRVITCSEPWVTAYDAASGAELWRAKCLEGEIGPSPVYRDGVVYVACDGSAVTAIRDGGAGDVTGTHVLWSSEIGLPDICSPLATDKLLLLVASYGDLVCYDRLQGGQGEDQEPLWEEPLDDVLFASPSLVGDHIYLLGEQGKGWVIRATASGMETVAENDLGEACSASPAFQSGRIYIRGAKHLYCIGREQD